MDKIPIVSGKALVAALKKIGFTVVRQKGSHISMRKGVLRTVIPLHDELAKGTLLNILRQCGISREELIKLLK